MSEKDPPWFAPWKHRQASPHETRTGIVVRRANDPPPKLARICRPGELGRGSIVEHIHVGHDTVGPWWGYLVVIATTLPNAVQIRVIRTLNKGTPFPPAWLPVDDLYVPDGLAGLEPTDLDVDALEAAARLAWSDLPDPDRNALGLKAARTPFALDTDLISCNSGEGVSFISRDYGIPRPKP